MKEADGVVEIWAGRREKRGYGKRDQRAKHCDRYGASFRGRMARPALRGGHSPSPHTGGRNTASVRHSQNL